MSHEERSTLFRVALEVFENVLGHVDVQLRDVACVDLRDLARRLARHALEDSSGDLLEEGAHLRAHGLMPTIHRIGVRVEVVEEGVLHLVIAMRDRQGIVRFPQMPLAGEVCVVAALLQHRGQGPFGRGQATTLTLKRHRRHAAPVRETAGLHGCPARSAAWLPVERPKLNALTGERIEVGSGHAPAFAASVDAQIPPTGIVGDEQDDVGLFLGFCAAFRSDGLGRSQCHRNHGPDDHQARCPHGPLLCSHLDALLVVRSTTTELATRIVPMNQMHFFLILENRNS